MPYIGKGICQNAECGRDVDVSLDRSGMAYYRCGPCGFKGWQTNERGNRKFLSTVRRDVDQDEAPPAAAAPAHEPRESREITEPQPAAKASQKPAKRGTGSGFFFSGSK